MQNLSDDHKKTNENREDLKHNISNK